MCNSTPNTPLKNKPTISISYSFTGNHNWLKILYSLGIFHDQRKMSKKILFIYNANSDTGSKMLDFAHKIVSPATYNCKLCSLTFGNFIENKQWKDFRESLQAKGYELEFYHKDEFQKSYKSKFGHKYTYPIILEETAHDLEVLVSK